MINFLSENWMNILAILLVILIIAYVIYTKQTTIVKSWLLFAVSEAEKYLGSKTGELKLEYVYDLFMLRFPILKLFISKELFKKLVDDALDKMRDLIENNENIKEAIKGVSEDEK